MYEFWYDYISINTMQENAIGIQIVLSLILKLKMFMKMLQVILKKI